MSRLIDADALMEIYMDRLSLVADRYSPDSSECGILTGAVKLLDAQPTIEERKKGTWNRYYRMHSGDTFVCNRCGSCFAVIQGADKMYFCPNCGSDNMG